MLKLQGVRIRLLSMLLAFYGVTTALVAAQLNQAFPIQGSVRDMTQSTSASGVSLNVHFQQIQYSGNVSGATIEKSGDHYQVEATLKDVVLRIGRTSIKGGFRIAADAGPMSIRLGTKHDLRVRYKVAIEQNQVRILGTSLNLDRDNWEIGRPSSVKTSGFGVTEQRVVNGLQQGLRENRARIERILIEESGRILAPMRSTILAHANPQTAPQMAPQPETAQGTQIATTAPGGAKPDDYRQKNELGKTKNGLAEMAPMREPNWIAMRNDTGDKPLPTRFTTSPALTEVAPPVGELVSCPPQRNLRQRVRSLFRGTFGILGFAY